MMVRRTPPPALLFGPSGALLVCPPPAFLISNPPTTPGPVLLLRLQMAGCEAYNALCAEGSVVEQCGAPGPIPGLPGTFLVREAISSLCSTHYMVRPRPGGELLKRGHAALLGLCARVRWVAQRPALVAPSANVVTLCPRRMPAYPSPAGWLLRVHALGRTRRHDLWQLHHARPAGRAEPPVLRWVPLAPGGGAVLPLPHAGPSVPLARSPSAHARLSGAPCVPPHLRSLPISAMPDMPECTAPPAGSGIKEVCALPEVAATFPLVCVSPPNPHTPEGSPPVLPGCVPTGGAPSPAPAAGAPPPTPATGAASAAWAHLPLAIPTLLLAALAAAMA